MVWVKKGPLFLTGNEDNRNVGIGETVGKFFKQSVERDRWFLYLVRVKFGVKWKAVEKKNKIAIPVEYTRVWPNGIDAHERDRAGITHICGGKRECQLDTFENICDVQKTMILERDIKFARLQTKVMQMIDDIKKSGTQNPILLAHAEVERELGI